ncbi:DinB family protein [bacterium]|nr:MAG: DinB family protein [bacterium]
MNAYLLALRHTPAILERILDDVSPARYGDRVSDDRFTLLEMVCHMADFEDIYLERMRAALKTDGIEVADVDEGQRAKDKHYDCRDLHKELEVLANRRRDTIDFLEGLTEDQLNRSFTKEGMGKVTIKEYLAILAGHDLYHLEQATWYLKAVHARVEA